VFEESCGGTLARERLEEALGRRYDRPRIQSVTGRVADGDREDTVRGKMKVVVVAADFGRRSHEGRDLDPFDLWNRRGQHRELERPRLLELLCLPRVLGFEQRKPRMLL